MVKVKLLAPDVIAIETPGKVADVTRAQAREIIVGLAKALDDGTYLSFSAECMTTEGDHVSVEPVEGGVEISMLSEGGGRPPAIHLRRECAVSTAIAMISFAGEVEE